MFGSLEQQVHSNDQTVKISKIACIFFQSLHELKKNNNPQEQGNWCLCGE